jgi:acyl transferase domain-containing protein
MLAVIAPVEEVGPLLPPGAFVAAVNGPRLVMVAGNPEALEQLTATIRSTGWQFRPIELSHPLHTPLLAGAVPGYQRALAELTLSEPRIAFYSGATGRVVSAGASTDPAFWARQLVEPVAFADGLAALIGEQDRLLLLELGPRRSLTTLARQAVAGTGHRVLPSLPAGPSEAPEEWQSLLTAVAGAWTEGQPIAWNVLEQLTEIGRTSVPGYPYERKRYWVDAAPEPISPVAPAVSPAAPLDQPTGATTLSRLEKVWLTLLGHPSIEPDGDFFDLGGNSLTAVELTVRIRAEFGVRLGIDSIFEHPTLDGLAGQIDQRAG